MKFRTYKLIEHLPLLFIFIMNPLWVILYSIFALANAIIEMWSHTQKHKKSELVSALSRGRTKEIFECLKCLHRTGLTKRFEFLSSISAILRRFYKCFKKGWDHLLFCTVDRPINTPTNTCWVLPVQG